LKSIVIFINQVCFSLFMDNEENTLLLNENSIKYVVETLSEILGEGAKLENWDVFSRFLRSAALRDVIILIDRLNENVKQEDKKIDTGISEEELTALSEEALSYKSHHETLLNLEDILKETKESIGENQEDLPPTVDNVFVKSYCKALHNGDVRSAKDLSTFFGFIPKIEPYLIKRCLDIWSHGEVRVDAGSGSKERVQLDDGILISTQTYEDIDTLRELLLGDIGMEEYRKNDKDGLVCYFVTEYKKHSQNVLGSNPPPLSQDRTMLFRKPKEK